MRDMNKISDEKAGFWDIEMWEMLLTVLHQEPPPAPGLENFPVCAIKVSESVFCSQFSKIFPSQHKGCFVGVFL